MDRNKNLESEILEFKDTRKIDHSLKELNVDLDTLETNID